MASNCYNLWVEKQNTKGQKKWVNTGPASDGTCADCPEPQYPAAGTWNGYSAGCKDGDIVKFVADGSGGLMESNEILVEDSSVCSGSQFLGPGRISDYF